MSPWLQPDSTVDVVRRNSEEVGVWCNVIRWTKWEYTNLYSKHLVQLLLHENEQPSIQCHNLLVVSPVLLLLYPLLQNRLKLPMSFFNAGADYSHPSNFISDRINPIWRKNAANLTRYTTKPPLRKSHICTWFDFLWLQSDIIVAFLYNVLCISIQCSITSCVVNTLFDLQLVHKCILLWNVMQLQ